MSYYDMNDPSTPYQYPHSPYLQNSETAGARYPMPPREPRQQHMPLASPTPRPRQTLPSEKRMPKAEALSLAQKLKRWTVVASVVTFGVIGALAVGHVTGATPQSPSSATQQQSTPASPSQNGSFFQQQQGGSQFGSSSSSQAPVTTSRTS